MHPKYPESLNALIAHLKKLPGVGSRTAERFAFEFIRWKQENLLELSQRLAALPKEIIPCGTCGCLTQQGACRFCELGQRDPHSMCILSSPRDVYAIEETHTFRGLYHVIEHLLSPLDGRHTAALRVDRIEERIVRHQVKEVILAFDSTLEGDTTALYLKQQLAKHSVSISRLAFGLPVGSSLEYVDEGTLAKAFSGRQVL
jgi:recombination protein RecR